MLRIVPTVVLLFVLVVAAACGGDGSGDGAPGGGPGSPGGGPPPMPVETVMLADKPLEQTSEYIASLKSRRSTTIQPQVEGFLTRIAVRSGEHVRQGALLFEIDSAPQQAGLASLESTRAVRDAELAYATQELARTKTLYSAGAVSQRELAQAETAARTAEAALKALDEQIAAAEVGARLLPRHGPDDRYRRRHPRAPGRSRHEHHRADHGGRERRPRDLRQRAGTAGAGLKVGLPVRIVDDRARCSPPTRSPSCPRRRADADSAGESGAGGRTRRLPRRSARARAVGVARGAGSEHSAHPVTRINGQFFAYVSRNRPR